MKRISIALGLLVSTIVNARTPCDAGEVYYPVDSDACLPKFMATFLTCAEKLGGGQLDIKTAVVKQGTQVIVDASGEGKGFIVGGKGHAEVIVNPGTTIEAVERVFAPNVLTACMEATKRSLPAKEEAQRKRVTPVKPAVSNKGESTVVKPAPEVVEFPVPANRGWKDSFWLKPGKIAKITASGRWYVIRDSGPGGNGVTAGRPSFVAPGSPEGALIVRDAKGGMHAFTSDGQQIVIGTEGQLSFQANDEYSSKGSWGHNGFGDNKGELKVKIVVEGVQ